MYLIGVSLKLVFPAEPSNTSAHQFGLATARALARFPPRNFGGEGIGLGAGGGAYLLSLIGGEIGVIGVAGDIQRDPRAEP